MQIISLFHFKSEQLELKTTPISSRLWVKSGVHLECHKSFSGQHKDIEPCTNTVKPKGNLESINIVMSLNCGRRREDLENANACMHACMHAEQFQGSIPGPTVLL